MRSLIFVVVFFLSSLQVDGQSVFTSNEFKRGIYKDFREFVTNNPSLNLDEKIWIEEGEKNLLDNYKMGLFFYEGNRVKLPIYRLKSGTQLDTKDFWGYCDSSKFYINSFTHIPRQYFVQLLLVGRYCYFIQIDPNSNSSPPGTIVNPMNSNGVAEYIVNVNNGKIFKLDRKLLKVILQDDIDLLKEFNSDKEIKNKLLIEYIDRYNKRHFDEIKVLK
jgi:hypothetical protein